MRSLNIFSFAGRSLALGAMAARKDGRSSLERNLAGGVCPRPSLLPDCITVESAKTPSGRPGQPRTATGLNSHAADLTGFGLRFLGAVLLRQRLRRIALFFRGYAARARRAFRYADSGLLLVALLLFLASAGMGIFGAVVMAVAS